MTRGLGLFAVLCALGSLRLVSAEPKAGNDKSQAGRLAAARLPAKQAPDGMRYLFLVHRGADVKGNFTLKETRDFLLGGRSYQEKTQADLGQQFEPGTTVNDAEAFFAKQPGMRHLAGEADLKEARLLLMVFPGTKLEAGGRAEITLNIGFDKEVEPFTFRTRVPPAPGEASGPKPAKT